MTHFDETFCRVCGEKYPNCTCAKERREDVQLANFWRSAFLEKRGDSISLPEIVCLCGSSRFYREFQQAEYDLTMEGKIYLSIGFYPHAAAEMHGEGVGHTPAEKLILDELHKRKIDLSDWVLVLNVGGYIGDSTRSEIEYAKRTGKRVKYKEAQSQISAGVPVSHGVDCVKAAHTGTGYLHGEYDDAPYDVDGAQYCGRCHSVL